ncbi:hypothetical protein OMW55_01270 [Sphingomonas sp. BN140010]|uniref:Rod shape-determining protein MreD n=1 Tax=Sphingomonas arvum TaxID=2992113 RepID=A0ABT3JBP3_9SPHN|nr:hypothetical protein [Sphingomonas sp. BN140010]MCW3796441.1 hypothetical protein [Sphingomonas sp. BN140010]
MIRIAIYYLLVLTGVAAAFRYGDRETRWGACICLLASLVSSALLTLKNPVAQDVAVVDVAVLACFVALSLKTERFWPLWVAGLQLTTVLGHVLRLLEPSLMDIAYAAAMRFWSYPILLIVIAAAWRSKRYGSRAPEPAA